MRPRRNRISYENLMKMGVPKAYCKLTLDDYETSGSKKLNIVKTYVKDYIRHMPYNIENNKGIFFYGSNGVGKSMLSCILLKEAYINRYTARRITFSSYIQEYTRIWDAKSVNEKESLEETFFQYYKSVEFLVLEEVGKELDTKLSATVLEDLLRYREEKGLVTIICTNLHPKQLVEKYGASIESLIKGNFTPINIVGEDNRISRYKER